MKQFAKLFERNGEQVLVTLHEDEPGVVVKFRDANEIAYVSPAITFKPKGSDDAAVDAAWAAAEKFFAGITEDSAFDMRTKMLTQLGLETGA